MSKGFAITRFYEAAADNYIDESEMTLIDTGFQDDRRANSGEDPLENLALGARMARDVYLNRQTEIRYAPLARSYFNFFLSDVVDEAYNRCNHMEIRNFSDFWNGLLYRFSDGHYGYLYPERPQFCTDLPDRAALDRFPWGL
jgi:hypothetical protein